MSSVSRVSPAEELAAFLARGPSPQEIADFHLSDAALERVRALLDKNENDLLTPEESRELDRLVLLDDIIALVQSQIPLADRQPGTSTRGERANGSPAQPDGSATSITTETPAE